MGRFFMFPVIRLQARSENVLIIDSLVGLTDMQRWSSLSLMHLTSVAALEVAQVS